MFALVPLSMVVFGVLSAFPVFGVWSDRLSDYVFANFVPSAARSVEAYLKQFSANAGQLTTAGVVALVVSLLITLNGVEAAFNRIWRVKAARPKVGRFLVYWTVFTLGCADGGGEPGDLRQVLRHVGVRDHGRQRAAGTTCCGWRRCRSSWSPSPRSTRWCRTARSSGATPSPVRCWRRSLFEAVKWGLGLYLGSFNSYSKIYGTLAAVPIFLLWIYLSWVAVLLGASLASSISAFRYQPAAMRLPLGYEMYGLLRLLARFNEARKHGHGLHSDEIQRMEPMLTDTLVQQMLAQLCEINVVRRAEDGEWLLARDLDELTMAELYEACQLRIPIAEAHLPCREDSLGRAAVAAMDELRIPLRDLLKRRVSTIHADHEE